MPGRSAAKTEAIPDANPGTGLFGDIGERLGYQLHATDVLAMDLIRGMLAELGLTATRATALAYIRTHPGCRQAELGRALSINRASAMEVVNALTALGAVAPRQQGVSRRGGIHLTLRGETLYEEFRMASLRADAVSFGGLSETERETLRVLLARVRASTLDFTTNSNTKEGI
ncbi:MULTISPECIES: MarR family winged helix-turn-helix transcriptional regulator [unclassified Novosphingobium]|jgi:DNA-binding MarR family transcriptional regulator|uniref:MarR family winged helix-turn-helix transcriptional regulator n=1 Tax=unclassified Novosphingobium TaxID=2644732 RepID=UPI001CC2035B|nr:MULTISPECIES: MarR family winged helix-turn-helix transcriptional regulator [unclassified Novosphingobium]